MKHETQLGNPPQRLCLRTWSSAFEGAELRGSAWPGTKKPSPAGQRKANCQAHGTARAWPSAVLTAGFSADWTQRAWQRAAAGKHRPG